MSKRNAGSTALNGYAGACEPEGVSPVVGTETHGVHVESENPAVSQLAQQLDYLWLNLRHYRRCWEWQIACLADRLQAKKRRFGAGTLPAMLLHVECLLCDIRLDVAETSDEWAKMSRVLNDIRTVLADLRFSRRLHVARRLPFRPRRFNIDRLLDEVMAIQTLLADLSRKHEDAGGVAVVNAAAEAWPTKSVYPDSQIRVDVIVPVYRGIEETLRCLWSVLQARVQTVYQLIVVDDCGPEPQLTAKLAELAQLKRLVLLRNPRNCGFVESVNRGMAEHVNRDVVLLNSDTLVHDGWLDRLADAGQRPRVGTVTPLANTAGIFSYPRVNLHNPLPADADSNALNTLAARVNDGAVFTAPTAVGFCMYIKRECLREVGLFDAANFGLGYGEENDFCMRATKKGWLHLGCPSTFVYHAANVSFGPTFRHRVRRAYHTLKRLHPEYSRLVKNHLRLDPGRQYRCRLDLARQVAANQLRPAVLHVLSQSSGPQRRHVDLLCERLWQRGMASFLVVPDFETGARVLLINPRIEETPNAVFDLGQEWDALVAALRVGHVGHIHFHDVSWKKKALRSLPQILNCSYDLTLGEVIDPRTQVDVETDVDAAEFFRGARRLFMLAPDQAGEVRRIAPQQTCLVRTCGTAPAGGPPPAPTLEPAIPRRVLILQDVQTAGGLNQGAAALRAACKYAARRRLPLRFFIGGGSSAQRWPTGEACTMMEPWSPRHWNQYLALAKPHLVLLIASGLASADEMLDFCIRRALMPVAFDDNVVASRIRTLQWGKVMPGSCTAARINDTLLELIPVPPTRPGDPSGLMLFEQYVGTEDYYDGLTLPG